MAARQAAPAKSAHRHGQPELPAEVERSVGRRDRGLALVGGGADGCPVGDHFHLLCGRRLILEKGGSAGCDLNRPGVPLQPERACEPAGRNGLGPQFSGLTEAKKTSLERRPGLDEIATLQQGLAVGDQQTRHERASLGAPTYRVPVVTLGRDHVQRQRPVARRPQRVDRGLREAAGELAVPGRLSQFQRALVVVGEDPGGGEPQLAAFDPLCHGCMLRRPDTARQGGVHHLPGQAVPEGVLGLSRQRRGGHQPDELPFRQLAQTVVDAALVGLAGGGESSRPERLPHHGGIREHILQLRVQSVEPGGYERGERVWKHGRGGLLPPGRRRTQQQRALAQQSHELLSEEGVAAAALGDGRLDLGGSGARQEPHEPPCLVG